jgi:general secretion pathway protein A
LYTEFYNLSGRPFQLTPDPRFYFDSRTHSKAMAYLTYGLSQGEGFIVVTGEVGAGKTTMVGSMLESIDTSQYIAGKVVTTQLEADNFLRMIAEAFELHQEGLDKASLLTHLETFLSEVHQDGKRAVLVVDEAQNLSNGALEELRMLSNFQIGDTALLQSILVGQPQFRDRLAQDPDLEQVRQRIIAHYHLLPMEDATETGDYIFHRLSLVDWDGDPNFTEASIEAIHAYTGGIPRRLNTLCSRLLLYGFLEEAHVIDEEVVAMVVAELDDPGNPAGGSVLSSSKDASLDGSETGALIEQLDNRIDLLEKYVSAHERAINMAIEIARVKYPEAAESVSSNRATPAKAPTS